MDILTRTEDTPIALDVFDLTVVWKSTSQSFSLPWLMMHCMKAQAEGLMSSEPGLRWLGLLVKRLEKRLTCFRHAQKQELFKVLHDLNTELVEDSQSRPFIYDTSDVFKGFCKETEFQLFLWLLQRQCYSFLYFAYEFFLVCMYIKLTNAESYRISKESAKDFRAVFTEKGLVERCWTDPKINLARVCRHSIAHAGGRITRDLSKQLKDTRLKDDVVIEDGQIHVLPFQNVNLYKLLEERASEVIEFMLKKVK
jgi:hypothetical protein